MKTTNQSFQRRFAKLQAAATGLMACLALGFVLGTSSYGGDMYRTPFLPSQFSGGVPAQSIAGLTNISSTNVTVCGYGMQGWYDIQMSTNLSTWVTAGHNYATDFSWCITATNVFGSPSAMVRLNQANSYVGQGGCAGCHGDKFQEWQTTHHSRAYEDLVAGFHTTSCYACHTVGFGQPTGFTDITNTPQLTEVGCENCHGPAGWHKNSDHALIHPAVSIDPAICGSCHSGPMSPTYDEYVTTLHAQVNDDVKYGNNSGTFYPDTLAFNRPVYTNALGVVISNYYGYYVNTNADLTLKTNANSGIVNSFHIPGDVVDPGQDRQASCGVCHSGATRSAMIEDYEARLAGQTNALSLPTANDSGSWGPTCAVCHDPHDNYNVAQLRNPTRSTNYFTMATTTDKRVGNGAIAYYNTTFASLYDPNIQVCGQCHNTRGARWDGLAYGLLTNTTVLGPVTNAVVVDVYTNIITTNVLANGTLAYLTNRYVIGQATNYLVSTPTNTTIYVGVTTNVTGFSRPPHNSPQYNILIGIVQPDYLNTNGFGVATNYPHPHNSAGNSKMCATCHVPHYAVNSSTNVTGHTFELDTHGCNLSGCHLSGIPDIAGNQVYTTNKLSNLVDLLNQWATNYAPAILGSAYTNSLQNSWEYTLPGALAGVTNAGPSSTNQKKLPTAIQQARFDAYMVRNDGSLGVHNPNYLQFLLIDAENKILGQFSGASFKASAINPWTNTVVTFTNLNNAVAASSTWTFGDGTPASSGLGPMPHVYTSAGTYSITLTTTDTNGITTTLTRDNYITVYPKPVPSFTFGPTNGVHPLTVTFTNTSLNADYYRWTFMVGTNGGPYSNTSDPIFTFTYTNAGTYFISLRGYNAGGSGTQPGNVTATSVIPIQVQ